MTNDTSASGSASAASFGAAPGWRLGLARIFCGLKAGMLAESSDTESDRLPATRTNGRTRTISRLPTPRVVVDTRMTWRAALASPGGGRRSVLRVTLAMRSAMPIARRAARLRRAPARWRNWSRRRATAKTAPPIRAAPQRPVRIVPLNHCTETRRRSTRPLRLAVDRQRRFVAEVDVLGLAPDRYAPRACRDPSPTSPPLAPAGGLPRHATEGAKRGRDDWPLT